MCCIRLTEEVDYCEVYMNILYGAQGLTVLTDIRRT